MAAVGVAIDGGKTSKAALKWAVENIFSRSQNMILVHVRCNAGADKRLVGPAKGKDGTSATNKKCQIFYVGENKFGFFFLFVGADMSTGMPMDNEMKELFRSFIGYCKRKTVSYIPSCGSCYYVIRPENGMLYDFFL